MKLWVDDVRPPPSDEWTWVMTLLEADEALHRLDWDVVSLDHDMGDGRDTRGLVLWLCANPERWPGEVRVHSMNPVGREWLESMVERYKP